MTTAHSSPAMGSIRRQLAVADPIPFPRWLTAWPGGVLCTLLGSAFLTAVMAPRLDIGQVLDVGLVYVAFTLIIASFWGYAVGIFAAVLVDLLVNFFFVPPLYQLTVSDPANIVALVVLLVVAVFGASIVARARRSVVLLRALQMENAILLATVERSAEEPRADEAARQFCQAISQLLGSDRCEIARAHEAGWQLDASSEEGAVLHPIGVAAAEEAWRSDRVLGDELARRRDDAGGGFVSVPLPRAAAAAGVLRIANPLSIPESVDRERLLRALAAEAAVALHRLDLAAEAREARRAEVAAALNGTILSTLSHDLRSPLTAIKAAVSNLRDTAIEWSEDDSARFLEAIETQTDRVIGLLTDLVELSRLDAGAVATRLEPIEVEALLEDVVVGASAGGRTVTTTSERGLWVRADYRLLMQALGNLVENAVRYSIPGGAIRISARVTAAGAIAIAVSDEGPGIPANDLPHVFDRFYRGVQAHQTTGTGLGLSITRALVGLCGGAVDIRSAHSGTTVTVTLTRSEAPR